MKVSALRDRMFNSSSKEFVYLKRHVPPELAAEVMALKIPGISLQREYRRYYPDGEAAAHVVGFTNVDDVGQEGMELAYNELLRGRNGAKWVIKDRFGRVVENVRSIREPSPGGDLMLSIDRRLQYLAYRELKAAVQMHHARSASAVVLNARTGEVLAMVNQPSYNPNNRGSLRGARFRNRAVTDVFEPGSTIKPITVAAALESGAYRPDSVIDTSPGYFRVGSNTIRDAANYGAIDVTTVIQKSSNVGASKIALSIKPKQLWNMFARVGFGATTNSRFPGEVTGLLTDYGRWGDIERATLSFGYGVSVTALQLAQAYMVLADKGRVKDVSFTPIDVPQITGQALNERTATQVMRMMEAVVSDKGTGTLAHVQGYRVAGKTGTVQLSGVGGYSDEHYISLFAGIAPASDPSLVMVVVITEPQGAEYYGGRVAAPVFSKVMAGSLRLLGVTPDDVPLRLTREAAARHELASRHVM
jgi:cell division protein FtsI (penicillin-binding protein 3)